jgi:protein involved in polysaccharide export with SLBB domain
MRKILLIVCLVPFLSGCAWWDHIFNPNAGIELSPQAFREVCKEAGEGDQNLTGSNLQARVLAVGMQISVTVNEDSTLNRPYSIPASCSVDFAAAGRISVCGLTADELAGKIKAALERDYFAHATVAVTVESMFTPEKGAGIVYVLGEVQRPGPMQLPAENFTVTKAIIAASGFTAFAHGDNVRVVRYCADGRKYVTHVNVERIMSKGEFENDIPLRPNDWIYVPQKFISLF